MSFAQKHNSPVAHFDFTAPEDFIYKKLSDMGVEYGLKTAHVVRALYINKGGRFGDSPVVVTNNEYVNLPAHMLESVKEILSDEMSVSMINGGVVGFTIYTYENKYGMSYSLEWIDL